MKKIIASLIIVLLALFLVGCNKKIDNKTTDNVKLNKVIENWFESDSEYSADCIKEEYGIYNCDNTIINFKNSTIETYNPTSKYYYLSKQYYEEISNSYQYCNNNTCFCKNKKCEVNYNPNNDELKCNGECPNVSKDYEIWKKLKEDVKNGQESSEELVIIFETLFGNRKNWYVEE